MADAGWQGWFVRLSGWPVFLVVVLATIGLAVLAMVWMTRAANRPVAHNIAFAVLAAALLAVLALAAVAVLSRLG